MPDQQSGVTQQQFEIYGVSQQAQMKQLIFYQKCEVYIDFAVLITLMVTLVFNGFNRMR